MADTALSIVQQAYAAFDRGDVSGVVALLAPQVRWEVVGPDGAVPTFGVRQGRDAALAFFVAVDATVMIEEFTPQRFHAVDDTVIVEGRCTGVFRRNNRRLSYDWLHVWRIGGGEVTSFREFYDTAAVLEAFSA